MKNQLTTRLPRLVLFTGGILLIFLFIYRAACNSITWDEVYTLQEFVRVPNLLPHDFNYMSANDHLLNTWCMKISVFLFGSGELALRLPNVLAGIIFLFILHRLLLLLIRDRWRSVCAFFFVAANPYLIDFFTIARGYGLAVMLLTGGIHQACLFLHSGTPRHLYRSQLLLSLMLLSVLSFIHAWAGILFFLAAHILLNKNNREKWKLLILFSLIPLITLAVLTPYIFHLDEAGAFFLGKETKDPLLIVTSLSDATLYDLSLPGLIFRVMGKIFLLLMPLALFLWWRQKRRDRDQFLFVIVAAVCSSITPALLHYFTGSNLLSGRSALFLLPMLLLLFVLILDSFRKWGAMLLYFFTGLFLANGIFHSTRGTYYDWKEQADVKNMMKELRTMNIKVEEPFFANVIGTGLPYDLPVNYYIMRYGLTTFGHSERGEDVVGCTWKYLPVADTLHYKSAGVIKIFPRSGTALFREQKPVTPMKVLMEAWSDFENIDPEQVKEVSRDTIYFGGKGTFANAGVEFSLSTSIVIPDSLRGKACCVTASFRVRNSTRWSSGLIIFRIGTPGKERWEAMHVNELPVAPGEWSLTGWTESLPADAREVSVYLWNRDEKPVYMDNVALKLLMEK